MGSGTRIPAETIDHMRQVYVETGSCAKVAQECGVSEPTVRKYVRRGDVTRGVLPLAADAMVANLRQSETVTTVEYTDAEIEANGMDQLRRLDRVIALAFAKLEGSLVAKKKPSTSLRLTDVAKACQIRQQLVSAYGCLITTSRTTTASSSATTPAEFDGRSPAELSYYADTGTWPDEIELRRYESDRRAALPESHLPPVDPRTEVWPKE